MIKVDVTRHLDPEMAAAVAESQRLYGEIVAERGPVAPDDLDGQRASYNHERAFWNAIKPALAAVEPLEIPDPAAPLPAASIVPAMRGRCRRLSISTAAAGSWAISIPMTGSCACWRRNRVRRCWASIIAWRRSINSRPPMTMRSRPSASGREGPALGIDAARLALGGDFAGANLALATWLQLGPEARAAVRCLLLYYGAFGLHDSPSRRAFGNELDGLTKEGIERFRACLVRGPADLADIRLDCLAGDLRGLPRPSSRPRPSILSWTTAGPWPSSWARWAWLMSWWSMRACCMASCISAAWSPRPRRPWTPGLRR